MPTWTPTVNQVQLSGRRIACDHRLYQVFPAHPIDQNGKDVQSDQAVDQILGECMPAREAGGQIAADISRQRTLHHDVIVGKEPGDSLVRYQSKQCDDGPGAQWVVARISLGG